MSELTDDQKLARRKHLTKAGLLGDGCWHERDDLGCSCGFLRKIAPGENAWSYSKHRQECVIAAHTDAHIERQLHGNDPYGPNAGNIVYGEDGVAERFRKISEPDDYTDSPWTTLCEDAYCSVDRAPWDFAGIITTPTLLLEEICKATGFKEPHHGDEREDTER